MRIASKLAWLAAVAATVWAGQEIKEGPGETVVPDEIVLRLKPGANLTGVLRSLNISATTVASGTRLPVQVIRVPAGLRQTLSTILADHPQIEYVEPHRMRSVTDLTPNDTSFAVQWWLSRMQAGAAWSLLPGRLTPPGPALARVRIAVLDTGADCTHPDFRNVAGGSTDSASGGQFSYSLSQAHVPTTIVGAACAWQDDHGHGTHVAGLLAAATNNAEGVAGLGFPAELMIFKVLGKTGAGTDFQIADAIATAADGGARIISLSLGGAGYSQLLQDAVNYAKSRNSLVIAAAGNSNTSSLFFPAGANFVLGVGATDSADVRAYFSNYGFGLDVMAPGVSLLSTYPGNKYQSMSGTSMATPLVSALAGLIAASTPALASDALAQRIQMAADSTIALGGWDPNYGYGRVNALRSLNGMFRAATAGGLTGQVVNTAGVPVLGAQVTVQGILALTSSTGLFRFANLNTGAATVTVSDGVNPTWSHNVVIPPGADSSVMVTLGVPTGDLTGSVTSAGTALSGAVVQAVQSGIVQASAVTDANGQFTLAVAAGTYDLRASAVGHAAYTQSAQTVAAGGSAFMSLPMLPFGTIRGKVVDDSNAPWAGVQLTVDNGVFSAGAVTDANGAYSSLGLPAGTYSVNASLLGLSSSSVLGVAVVDGASTVANLQLARTGVLSSLTLAASSIGGGATRPGNRVTLTSPAGPSAVTVTLSSSNPAVALPPATVTIPAGATQSPLFSITTSTVTVNTAVTITASLGGITKSANLTVIPFVVTSVSLSPLQMGGGASSTGNRVFLNSLAPPGGAVIQLESSNPAVVSVPANVTVLEGASFSPPFTVGSTPVPASTPVTITATYGASVKTAVLTVTPTALASLSISPLIIAGGKPITTASVTLDSPAPAGGAVVLLSSTDASAVPPASVTVPAGTRYSTYFTIATAAVPAALPVTIGASYGGVTKSVSITVKPPALNALSVSTTPISGGTTIAGATVSLDGPAPAAGAVVSLVSTNPAVIPPATVSIAPGATVSPAFTISTLQVSSQIQVTLTAAYGGVSKSVILTLNSPALAALSISTAPIAGGKPISGATVTLAGPAPAAGAVVTFTSSNAALATPPPSISIAAGATVSPPFTVSTGFVTAATPVVITATYGGVPKTVTVNVKPTALYGFSLSTTPVSGGKTMGGATVTLDGPAPAAGAVVTLTSSQPALATPPATVTVPGGATASAAFTVPTGFVTAATPVAITATYGGVSKVVTINLKPTALLVFSLSTAAVAGGRAIGGGSVTLDGPAPPAGAVITLTSANSEAAIPPATVTIPGGATASAAFTVPTGFVTTATPVAITATYGGVSKVVTVNVGPTAVHSLSLSTTPIPGGKPIGGARVTLDGPAAPAGAVVSLSSSNPAVASPPGIVTVVGGANLSAAFEVSTGFVTAPTAVVITATLGGVSKAVTVNVKPAALYGLYVSTTPIPGGKPIGGATVSIDGPAPPAGAVVSLTSANPAVALPPANVTIPSGSTVSPTFSVTTGFVTAATPVVITASYGGVSKSITVNVKSAVIANMNISATPITGGKPITGAYLSIDGPAPPGGAAVTFVSSNPAAAIPPATVTVPSGTTGPVFFSVATGAVAAATQVTITASYGGGSRSSIVTVKPPVLQAFTASPTSIKGGLIIGTASATLDGPAPVGGAVVTLSSSNAAAQPASSVTVPAGATVFVFTIPTQVVAVSTPATVTASTGGVSKLLSLTINP